MKKFIIGAHVVFLIVALFASSVFPVTYVSAQLVADGEAAVAPTDGPIGATPFGPAPHGHADPIPGDMAPMPIPHDGGTPVDGDVQNTAPVLTVSPGTVRVVTGDSFDESSVVVTAMDLEEGNITSRISIVSDQPVNTNVVGTYTRVYKVEDLQGLSDTKNRVVNVVRRAVVGDVNAENTAPNTLFI